MHKTLRPLKKSLVTLQQLPNSLLVAFVLFAALPFWSLSFIDLDAWHQGKSYGMAAALQILTYWVLPAAVCGAIVRRSFWVILLFLADCAGLIALAALDQRGSPLVVTKLAFLTVAMVLGPVIAQKDVLFPFLTRGNRFWRRAPRLFVNHQVELRTAAAADLRGMLEDCSLSGMAVTTTATAASDLRKGDVVEIHIVSRNQTIALRARVAWQSRVGEMRRLGFEAQDPATMKLFFTSVNEAVPPKAGVVMAVERLWAASAVRRSAVALFAVSMTLSFGMPACGGLSDRTIKTDKRMRIAASTESAAVVAAVSTAGVTSADAGWQPAAMTGLTGGIASFALEPNAASGTFVDIGQTLAGASLKIPMGAVKQKSTLAVQAGPSLYSEEFWDWLAVQPAAVLKRTYGSLTFTVDPPASETTSVTVRLPLPDGEDIDPKTFVVLYRVVRGGQAFYGTIGPDRLKVVSATSGYGLADAAAAVEFDVTASLTGSVELDELASPFELADHEHAGSMANATGDGLTDADHESNNVDAAEGSSGTDDEAIDTNGAGAKSAATGDSDVSVSQLFSDFPSPVEEELPVPTEADMELLPSSDASVCRPTITCGQTKIPTTLIISGSDFPRSFWIEASADTVGQVKLAYVPNSKYVFNSVDIAEYTVSVGCTTLPDGRLRWGFAGGPSNGTDAYFGNISVEDTGIFNPVAVTVSCMRNNLTPSCLSAFGFYFNGKTLTVRAP